MTPRPRPRTISAQATRGALSANAAKPRLQLHELCSALIAHRSPRSQRSSSSPTRSDGVTTCVVRVRLRHGSNQGQVFISRLREKGLAVADAVRLKPACDPARVRFAVRLLIASSRFSRSQASDMFADTCSQPVRTGAGNARTHIMRLRELGTAAQLGPSRPTLKKLQ